MMDLEECAWRQHGLYISEPSDSDSSQCEFDVEYHKHKPPLEPLGTQSIVVCEPFQLVRKKKKIRPAVTLAVKNIPKKIKRKSLMQNRLRKAKLIRLPNKPVEDDLQTSRSAHPEIVNLDLKKGKTRLEQYNITSYTDFPVLTPTDCKNVNMPTQLPLFNFDEVNNFRRCMSHQQNMHNLTNTFDDKKPSRRPRLAQVEPAVIEDVKSHSNLVDAQYNMVKKVPDLFKSCSNKSKDMNKNISDKVNQTLYPKKQVSIHTKTNNHTVQKVKENNPSIKSENARNRAMYQLRKRKEYERKQNMLHEALNIQHKQNNVIKTSKNCNKVYSYHNIPIQNTILPPNLVTKKFQEEVLHDIDRKLQNLKVKDDFNDVLTTQKNQNSLNFTAYMKKSLTTSVYKVKEPLVLSENESTKLRKCKANKHVDTVAVQKHNRNHRESNIPSLMEINPFVVRKTVKNKSKKNNRRTKAVQTDCITKKLCSTHTQTESKGIHNIYPDVPFALSSYENLLPYLRPGFDFQSRLSSLMFKNDES